jgi:hypothetical protein
MHVDFLTNDDGTFYAINSRIDHSSLEVGILCLMPGIEAITRITDDHHSMLVEIPPDLRSSHERVKAFNATLTILDHEQVQLSA